MSKNDPLPSDTPPAVSDKLDSMSSKDAKQRVTFQLSSEVVNHARNAVYWTPGLTMSGLAEMALRREIELLEEKRGRPFSERAQELKAGRPVKDSE